MAISETQPQLEWYPSMCLRTVIFCALGIGISFVSLSRRSAHPRFTLSLITIPIIIAFRSSSELSPDDSANEIFARFLLIFLAHQSFLHLALAPEEVERERRSFGAYTPGGRDASTEPRTRNWTFAYKMLFNARCLGTTWQVRHTTTLGKKNSATHTTIDAGQKRGMDERVIQSSASQSTTIMKPQPSSRVAFLLRRSGLLLLRYVALCVYYDESFHLYMPDGLAWKRKDFSPENQELFWRLIFSSKTALAQTCDFVTRGSFIRLHIVGDQVIPDYLILSSYHDILSILAVALRLDDPEDWPPLFGRITQAHTVRRYWSQFWHLLVYRSFNAHASYFLAKVTGTRKRSATTRYLNNAFVFILSGLMHALVEWTLSPDTCSRCGCWATHWRYCLQIGAILFEELVQKAAYAMERRLMSQREQSIFLNTLHRMVGYTWVFMWTLWSKEITFFPQAYCLLKDAEN